ncbi:MAG: glycine oxidase ThiO [Chloroflexi bacterium]|nr:glycine oxidase ThiO [Chloroflexota bacterium]MYF81999.1 glycine oxidase ThiO [Chloroflexota bacterium]MYI03541.1 glycine oxidase ThiO [Chloroflexota bacterium]
MNDAHGTADVAVIGAGIIGLSIALELSRRGRDVVVIERDRPGQHASTVAAGLLGTAALPLGEQDDIYPLKLDSLRRYAEFVANIESASGMDAGYRDDGTLWIARDAHEDALLDELHLERVDRGLLSRRVTSSQVYALEPNLEPGLLGGLIVNDDVQVDPRQLLPALTQAALASGVRIVEGQAVEDGEHDEAHERWTLANDGEAVALAREVVVTAGPWCDRILNRAGGRTEPLAPSGVGPVKGQLLRMRGPSLINRCIRTTNIDIAQRRHGELIVASTKEPEAGWDLTPTEEARMELLRRAYGVLPALRDAELSEHSVGLRPAVDDHMPIVGPAARHGLWLATGHYRHGILLAPATAHWLAEAMEHGLTPELIAPYGADRLGFQPQSMEAAS